VLVELTAEGVDGLRAAVSAVDAHGLEVRIAPAIASADPAGDGLEFDLVGQDRPGIVNQVTGVLSRLGANIETFKTWIDAESHTGAPLFHMETRLRLPPGLSIDKVQLALEAISGEIMVDVSLKPAS